ncbi:MAG: exodeoxyribonuclease VII small subunit [Verrucomicrobiae bacterium]|nr:exodeoxyribonuclease VII small subunit [Verrucomicrobiae bacterium]
MAAAKKKQAGGETEPEVTFERAMERLEEIVEEMEGAELPLEAILKRYEEGTRLRIFCERKLRDAEERVKKIRPGPGGEPVEGPLEEGGVDAGEGGEDPSGGGDELLL